MRAGFAIGARVTHEMHGPGTIEKLDRYCVDVRFDTPLPYKVIDPALVTFTGATVDDLCLEKPPLGDLDSWGRIRLAIEVERLRERVDGLLEANNREVERRRKAAFQRDTLKALLEKRPEHSVGHPEYNQWSRHAYDVEISVLMGGEA